MSRAKTPSLEEYERRKPGYPSQIAGLPEEVRAKLLASKVGHAPATRWLHDLGYTKVTAQQVGNWRRDNGWTK